jgi:hypothetical protein
LEFLAESATASFTRRMKGAANAFSEKWKNLKAACAPHLAYSNFCRIHRSLRVTPAMEAGITTRVWNLEDLLLA